MVLTIPYDGTVKWVAKEKMGYPVGNFFFAKSFLLKNSLPDCFSIHLQKDFFTALGISLVATSDQGSAFGIRNFLKKVD